MSVSIVVGGQYGGEGKGKIVSFLTMRDRPDIVARASGPNCRHRVGLGNGTLYDLRLIPASVVANHGRMLLGPGSLIHIPTLLEEMDFFHCHNSVGIDYKAGVIEEAHISQQTAMLHYGEIGTTYSGTGTASAERCLRRLKLARDCDSLYPYLTDVPMDIYRAIQAGNCVLVEGGQSFWLSNYHGDYPYVTSRDTTAAACASQLGIGPRHITEIVLVIKCFPTRNSSGRLPSEIYNPENHPALCMAEGVEGLPGPSQRTVRRRVGRFCPEDVVRAAVVNSATQIALTGADAYDPSCAYANEKEKLTHRVRALIEEIEDSVQVPVTLVSTGPFPAHTVDLRA